MRAGRDQDTLHSHQIGRHPLEDDPGDQDHKVFSALFSRNERTIGRGRLKLRAKAPMIALIAPDAPIIGIGDIGSSTYCPAAAA